MTNTQIEANAMENTQEQELNLNNWMELTEEQRETLKESLIKSKYGIGGEHFSTFPTLLDNKLNTWVEEKYNISKLPKRVQEGTFKKWEANGQIQILPLNKGERVHYLIILLPNKNIKMDLWELEKEDVKPFLTYTTHNLLGEHTLGKTHFHILNSYTNKNKAYHQAKTLVKLLQLGTNFKELEAQKELQTNSLQMDLINGEWVLKEIGKNSLKETGKTFKDIGEYLGRKQHKNIQFNYLENIN